MPLMTIAKVPWIGPLDSASRLCASIMTLVPFVMTKYMRMMITKITIRIHGLMIEIIMTTVPVRKKP